jgi:hypothetical protein
MTFTSAGWHDEIQKPRAEVTVEDEYSSSLTSDPYKWFQCRAPTDDGKYAVEMFKIQGLGITMDSVGISKGAPLRRGWDNIKTMGGIE